MSIMEISDEKQDIGKQRGYVVKVEGLPVKNVQGNAKLLSEVGLVVVGIHARQRKCEVSDTENCKNYGQHGEFLRLACAVKSKRIIADCKADGCRGEVRQPAEYVKPDRNEHF